MPKMPDFKTKNERKSFSTSRSFKSPEYNTREWQRIRAERLKRDPLCHDCKKALATVLDHIKPVRLGGDFWDISNHQPLCAKCHNRKSAKEGRIR